MSRPDGTDLRLAGVHPWPRAARTNTRFSSSPAGDLGEATPCTVIGLADLSYVATRDVEESELFFPAQPSWLSSRSRSGTTGWGWSGSAPAPS